MIGYIAYTRACRQDLDGVFAYMHSKYDFLFFENVMPKHQCINTDGHIQLRITVRVNIQNMAATNAASIARQQRVNTNSYVPSPVMQMGPYQKVRTQSEGVVQYHPGSGTYHRQVRTVSADAIPIQLPDGRIVYPVANPQPSPPPQHGPHQVVNVYRPQSAPVNVIPQPMVHRQPSHYVPWICKGCTFKNNGVMVKCEMCGVPKEGNANYNVNNNNQQQNAAPVPNFAPVPNAALVHHQHVPPHPQQQEIDLGPKWSCSECTFKNAAYLKKCQMCEHPKEDNNHDIMALQSLIEERDRSDANSEDEDEEKMERDHNNNKESIELQMAPQQKRPANMLEYQQKLTGNEYHSVPIGNNDDGINEIEEIEGIDGMDDKNETPYL